MSNVPSVATDSKSSSSKQVSSFNQPQSSSSNQPQPSSSSQQPSSSQPSSSSKVNVNKDNNKNNNVIPPKSEPKSQSLRIVHAHLGRKVNADAVVKFCLGLVESEKVEKDQNGKNEENRGTGKKAKTNETAKRIKKDSKHFHILGERSKKTTRLIQY